MNSEKTVLFPGVKDGETFMVGDVEFIKFPDVDGETPVMMKNVAFRSKFGNNNNLAESQILQRMQDEILPKIVEAVGEENVCSFETDLTTLDGLKPYENLTSRISLCTLDFYRAYAGIFQRHKPNCWWWLSTPESAHPNDDPWYILCVAPSGYVSINGYDIGNFGVRPFCIFKSSIFGSCEEYVAGGGI